MLAPGTRLGPYEIIGLIGEGGMGQVYRATDTRLDRIVAIKMLPASLAADPVRRERFEREARSVSRLEHPHICPLYDVGEHEGHLYIVMQFLDGETLAERIARGPLSIVHTLEFGIQIAEALAAAHRAGIVHRDLKPGNVMLTRAGARLLDFGLARPVTTQNPDRPPPLADRTETLTTEGTVLGTLHYMAPEQLDGREVDTRADVFAFGAVLFEMVTGLKAFDGESPARVMSAILRDEPARVSTLVPITPAGLDALIHACMAKDPNERWQELSDVARQLRWLQSSLSGGRSGSATDAGRRGAAARAGRAPLRRGRSPRRSQGPCGLAVLAGVIGARWFAAAPDAAPPLRLHALLLPPEGHVSDRRVGLSPDGRQLAFVAADAGGRRQLWIRPLDSPAARAHRRHRRTRAIRSGRPTAATSRFSPPVEAQARAGGRRRGHHDLRRRRGWRRHLGARRRDRLFAATSRAADARGGGRRPARGGDDHRRARWRRRITSIRRSCPTAGTSTFYINSQERGLYLGVDRRTRTRAAVRSRSRRCRRRRR